MSFELANNNLVIKNSNNEEIFNTDTPMPHITDWSLGVTINATFQNLTLYAVQFLEPTLNGYIPCGGYNQIIAAGRNHAYTPPTAYTLRGTIATLDVGFEPDFITVMGEVYRTSVTGVASTDHPQQRDYGVIPPGTPQTVYNSSTNSYASPGKINLTGTTILETTYTGQGEQWFTRALHCFYVPGNSTTGGTIVADFEHSNDWWMSDHNHVTYGSCAYPNSPPPYSFLTEDFSSDYTCVFDLYVGKFTN